VLVRLNYVTSGIENADQGMPTERQHIGNQIDTAMIFARSDFVNVHRIFSAMLQRDGAHGVRLTL